VTSSPDFDRLLDSIRPVPLSRLLYRGVSLNSLLGLTPPRPLYASRSPNRYNVRGTKTLYFGEDFASGYAEAVQENANLLRDSPTREKKAGSDYVLDEPEPIVLFAVRARVERVLDLVDRSILSKLDITEAPLLNPWRWESSQGHVPLTQALGDAAYRGLFEAIRFPSHKGHDPLRREDPACWAIFEDRIKSPSLLEVSDVSKFLQGTLP
jgi:hypothetical protein